MVQQGRRIKKMRNRGPGMDEEIDGGYSKGFEANGQDGVQLWKSVACGR